MAVQNLAVKAVVTPVLVGGASLAGRRWGHQVAGWLVALPMTSGPIAFFLALDQGNGFAAHAAVGMLAGTASQAVLILVYRGVPCGWMLRLLAGSAGFAFCTALLAWAGLQAFWTLAIVGVVLAGTVLAVRVTPHRAPSGSQARHSPRWDIPVRMAVATAVVLLITEFGPILGPLLAGLLSPFPVFGLTVALFNRYTYGEGADVASLEGLALGLAAPAVFFFSLATVLPLIGLLAFAVATAAAFGAQAVTMFALPAIGDASQ